MTYLGKKAYHGDIATQYDNDRINETIWQKEQDWLSTFLKDIPQNSSILDLPVGTGRFLELYVIHNLRVIGLDISDDMISVSKQKLAGLTTGQSNVMLNTGDAENISIDNGGVDYIFCFRLFHLVPLAVIRKILDEFYRVVNKQVIIEVFDSSFSTNQKLSAKQRLRKTFSVIYQSLFSTSTNHVQESATPWAHIKNFTYKYDQLMEMFKQTGFVDITVNHIDDALNPVTIFILTK